jgi:hypothetical protein
MAIIRKAGEGSLSDVVERVLEKGIVIDAMACVGLLGIDHVVDIDARVVVASIDTYLRYARPVSRVGLVARPVPTQAEAAPEENWPSSSSLRIPGPTHDHSAIGFNSTDWIRARGLSIRL